MNLKKIIAEHRHDEAELCSVIESLIDQAEARGWLAALGQSKKSMWLVGRAEIGAYLGISERSVSRRLSEMKRAGFKIYGTSRTPRLKPSHVDEFLEVAASGKINT